MNSKESLVFHWTGVYGEPQNHCNESCFKNRLWGMSRFLAIIACIVLAGCAAPPLLTYASMALDGASYAATGKSVGDHALSAAVDEDCAVLRVVTEQDVAAVCREYATQEERDAAMAPTVVAAFKTLMVEPDPRKVPTSSSEPVPMISVAYMTGTGETSMLQPVVDNRPAVFLMLGNFSSLDGAEKLAARVSGLSTVVSPAMAGDALSCRVVAGPIVAEDTGAVQSRLAAVGIGNSWAANLCTRDLGAPPCDSE